VFTGIIEATAAVAGVSPARGTTRLTLIAPEIVRETAIGDSIAVNGACLTVVEREGENLSFDAVPETLSRTNLGRLKPGDRVNLERPLRVGDRLDGHIVQGHVDGLGVIRRVQQEGDSFRIAVEAPAELLRCLVYKGSITVDGISLTVAALDEVGFEVAIIPHTWAVTNLRDRKPGEAVNLEVDVLAKYVERLLGGR